MHLESTPTWLIGPEIPPTQRIGTVLSGSYRLDAFLGQGMTGVTYNAWHLRQKQPYAVKLLHRELQPSHERVSRLRQDLRTLSGLRRSGFLPVELSFAPDGAPFLASELLTGETLRSRLSRGALPVLATGIVTAALARALREAHLQGIVHGDLRPENVLLPSEAGREIEAGQPVLLDAALHHLRRRPIGLDESLPLGKLVYLAPEQASGEQQTADAAGDIFALGAILYECLTGQQAFAAPEFEVVLEKLAAPPKKLVLPREVGAPPGLAEVLDEVIAKACARDPAERYQSMADFLVALDKAFAQSGLPLPPPDERVPIDTVKAQNRELRKRTIVVKKVVPLGPLTEMPETSGVMSAAAFAHLSSMMGSSSTPEPSEVAPASVPAESSEGTADKSTGNRRNTAKHRVVRRTVRARDLSRLLTEVETGRLNAEEALAFAAKAEAEAEPEPDEGVPEQVTDGKSEAQRIIDDGRAAVLARAEVAKKNRETDTKERQQREHVAAQEMQRKLLEQARQETLGRMRAEWEQSRPVPKVAAKGLTPEPRPQVSAEAKPDPQQAELLAEAQRQAQRLEAERTEAERRAAEEAEKARAEGQTAAAGRKEASRLEAELRAAEHREAERAEAVRRQSELEAEARRLAEEAERSRAAKQAAAEARHREAEEAQKAAEAKQREAAEAKHAAESAAESAAEVALWEDGFELVVDENKLDRTIPPPIPVAAMRARTEAARRAEAAAQQAQAEAVAAAAVAQRAQSDAAESGEQVAQARRAQEEAAAARAREAAELAVAVEAAEDVRAQDQALFRQVLEAEQRAKTAEAARVANVAYMSRVTQALQVIRQVQTFANEEPPSEPSSAVSAASPAVPSTTSADTGKFLRPAERPAGSEPADPISAVPAEPLSGQITPRTVVPAPPANVASPPEPTGSYAAFQVSPGLPRQDGSGAYSPVQQAAAGPRLPEPNAPQMHSAQSPALQAPSAPRADLSAGYTAAQLAAAGLRPDQSTGYTAAQLAAVGLRPDLSAGYTAAQLAAAGLRPDQSTGYTAAQLAAVGLRPDLSAGYTAAQLAAAGLRPDQSTGYTAAQLAAVGLRPDLSAGYTAAQLAAAGLRPDLSAGYTAAQLAAAGLRPDQSTGYTAAQLAAAGVRPMAQAVPQPLHAMSSQPQQSGLHPMAQGGATGRPDGDVSAMMHSPSMPRIPALQPTGMVPVLPGQMVPAPPQQEPGGVTLTTRQLAATLTMTSVLSGVIGALIALLVLQHTHRPTDSAIVATGGSVVEPTGPPTPLPSRSVQVAEAKPEPPRNVTSSVGAQVPSAVSPVSPTVAPVPPAIKGPGPLDTLVLQRGGMALPPLRLLSVAPAGLPHQSLWTRPGGPPASALARPPAPGTKPAPAATETVPIKKPAAESPAPAGNKPPAPASPQPAAKPGAKPTGAAANGLRDPFNR